MKYKIPQLEKKKTGKLIYMNIATRAGDRILSQLTSCPKNQME